MSPSQGQRKLTAILSADVVGYSRLIGADEQATVDTLKQYQQAIGRVIERHKGRIVDTPGDLVAPEDHRGVNRVLVYRSHISGPTDGADVQTLIDNGTIRMERVFSVDIPRRPKWLGL